jgi:hypothetical protein
MALHAGPHGAFATEGLSVRSVSFWQSNRGERLAWRQTGSASWTRPLMREAQSPVPFQPIPDAQIQADTPRGAPC